MSEKDEKNLYDSKRTPEMDAPEQNVEYSLEEILAEYSADQGQPAPREETISKLEPEETLLPEPGPEPETVFEPELEPEPEPESAEESVSELEPEAELDLEWEHSLPEDDIPPPPFSLEDVVGGTVDAVMQEEQREHRRRRPSKKPQQRRWGLFSRRPMPDTEELPAPPEPEPEPEPIGPEPDLLDVADHLRKECRRRERPISAAAAASLLLTGLMAADAYGLTVPGWTGQPVFQAVVMLACLAVVSFLARNVYGKALGMLAWKRCSYELMAVISALAATVDCVLRLLSPGRTDAVPYAAISCMALVFAMWGDARECQGDYDAFRAAAVDQEPPYLVTETAEGACKQRGSVSGFYTTARKPHFSIVWQSVLLPVILAASVVFALLSSIGQKRGSDFFLNWSAILCAGTTFALPLCWGLPWSLLSKNLYKAGCAVAGWSGAERISRQRKMILTDGDLFPPGSIQLNGVKLFGEELPHALSYAASMARAAGSGLERLFDGLIRSEGGHYVPVEDFSFYEEGGCSAAIHGESVLMGTDSFMKKMGVRLPGDIHLQTGVFLSVDRQLIAVFAVKYHASENVNFALQLTRRSHVTPILASRDPNITPVLLRRKFQKGIRVEYPDLTQRVALSEAELDQGLPRALLQREGLLPYAETVAGCRRLCRAVRRSVWVTFFASAAGTLLAFYLVFQGAYELLNPTSLMIFLLLWVLPVLLNSFRVGRY